MSFEKFEMNQKQFNSKFSKRRMPENEEKKTQKNHKSFGKETGNSGIQVSR